MVPGPASFWMFGQPEMLGESRGANPELYGKNPFRAGNYIARGDQASHGTLGIRPSDARWTELGLGRQQGSRQHHTVKSTSCFVGRPGPSDFLRIYGFLRTYVVGQRLGGE